MTTSDKALAMLQFVMSAQGFMIVVGALMFGVLMWFG